MGENRPMADLYEENQRLKARIEELEEKHWNECRQIAHYDDELRNQNDDVYVRKSDVLDLITEAYEDGGFKDYSDYDSLWDAVDDMRRGDERNES